MFFVWVLLLYGCEHAVLEVKYVFPHKRLNWGGHEEKEPSRLGRNSILSPWIIPVSRATPSSLETSAGKKMHLFALDAKITISSDPLSFCVFHSRTLPRNFDVFMPRQYFLFFIPRNEMNIITTKKPNTRATKNKQSKDSGFISANQAKGMTRSRSVHLG